MLTSRLTSRMQARAHTTAKRWWIAAVLLFSPALPVFAQQEAPPPDLEEKRVVAVRVVTEDGAVLKENPADLAQQPGAVFNSENVRESLRQLFRTGSFAEVRAETVEVPGGVRLDFVVRENFYVNRVFVEGLVPPPPEPVAKSALRLGLGQIYREADMLPALARLQRSLQGEGFYQAKVEHSTTPNPATRQIDVTVRVTPGPRARIGAIAVRNQTSFPDAEVLKRAKLKSKWTVKTERLERAAEHVRKFLVKKGYLGARAIFRRGEFDAQTNSLPLTLDVSAGPSVRVEVSGVRISNRDLRKLMPVYQEGTVDEDLLQEGRRNIRDYLEREGYFDSRVSYAVSLDAEKGQQVIAYTVERGPRRRLVGVAFEGNKYFSAELLREQVNVLPAALLSRGRFSQRLLHTDEDRLVALYAANGFREAKVQGEVVEDYAKREGDLFVRFHIAEGTQTLVHELVLEGNVALDSELLSSVTGSTAGQPFSEFNIASDRDNILALYYNEGFPEARFDWVAEELPGTGSVKLTYRIQEGTQILVKSIVIGGAEHTRPHVIEREVQLKQGQPLREGDVIETQRRLYNLGIFSRVAIAPQNPAGTEPAKTIVVQVEEAKRYTIAYGGAIEVQRLGSSSTDPVSGDFRASPAGLFEISRANVLGRGHTAAFKVRGSTLQSRALLSYTVPTYFGQREFSLLLTGFADRTTDVRTFSSRRYEGSVQIAQSPTPFSSILYRYSFRKVLVGDLKVSENQVPLFSQPTRISSFGVSFARDHRDNPADARKGQFLTADFSLAGRSIGSSATFLRFFVQNSTYHPVGRGLTFARSTRVGIEEPFRNTTPFDIPLPERFFAGGGTSLRGLALNQAGPRDANTGFPLGGLAMLLFNQELRFPMRLPFVQAPLGGAVFYDAGNVFSRANRITLRSTPLSPTDLNYFSHSIGIGFRYATPVGPVRVDLGYQLNAPRFEFCQDSATPTVPRCPAGQALRTDRLPRFQFFFSIGPSF